ncbi:hypothetical protein Scep_007118 [Stephania cephalantha]|uniref:Uncharacterized protein n=2 Tax=Stephania TaxID=147243 RepID=A0AAP0PPP7_9MAGN
MITNNVNFKGVKRNLNVYRIHDFIFHICKFKTHQPFQVQPHFSPPFDTIKKWGQASP